MTEPCDFIVSNDCHGLRLDQTLTRMTAGAGRRGARSIWERFAVLVDGWRRPAGFKVRAGQRVQLNPLENVGKEPQTDAPEFPEVRIAAQNDHFAALIKPAGMHSETLAGRVGPSVQAALPLLFPRSRAVLLNRLDQPVSGLALAALTDQGASDYALWQDQGLVCKSYLAVVFGHVRRDMEIKAALDTAKRRKVRVLSGQEPDALRWTRVWPLTYREERGESLVLVEILKGRRHQIRAHLAGAGHPITHDPLYGPGPDLGWIYLHHHSISLPGFAAEAAPEWLEPDGRICNTPLRDCRRSPQRMTGGLS